jgi:uncharacterized RDD family membrane protein YckC
MMMQMIKIRHIMDEERNQLHCLRCGAELAENQVGCSHCGFLEDILNQKEQPKAESKPETDGFDRDAYSGFWRRFSAVILDFLILVLSEGLLASVISGVILLMSFAGGHHVDFHIIGSFAVGFGSVFSFVLNWLYFTWFESSKFQATLGKKMMGLIVSDLHHHKITFGQANARYWSKALSAAILLGGFWMMAFMKRKQTLHDLLARTVVIRQEK